MCRCGNNRTAAVHDHLDGLRAVWRRTGRAHMLQDIDSGAESVFYRLLLIYVRMNPDVVFVRCVHNGLQFVVGQTSLGLDDVDATPNIVLSGPSGLFRVFDNDLTIIRKDCGTLNDPWA